jgi:hypothetical protein
VRRLLAVLACVLVVPHLGAQVATSEGPPPLQFLGFEPGASLDQVSTLVSELGGQRLKCDRARRDPAVSECRADLWDPATGTPIALWLSAVDSLSTVLTVSGTVTADQLSAWKDTLQVRFGLVGARVQGTQWMMQWVRQSRMLRLTWRIEKGQKVASVSLVDGPLLDRWGTSVEARK